MGEIQDKLYATDTPYGEADTLARKILKHGTFIFRDYYKYNGSYYWVVDGKVLTREQGAKLEDERRREQRAFLKDHGSVKTK